MEYRLHEKSVGQHIADILKMIQVEFRTYPWIGGREDVVRAGHFDCYNWVINLGAVYSTFCVGQGELSQWIEDERTPQEVMGRLWVRAHNAITALAEVHAESLRKEPSDSPPSQ